MKRFHEILKEKRIEKRISLRDFCRTIGIDAVTYSRIERGISSIPDKCILRKIGEALSFSGNELENFIRFGDSSRNKPFVILNDNQLAGKLPALLRSVNGSKPERRHLENAIGVTKKAFLP